MFAKLDPKRRTPDYAMGLNATLTTFYIIFGGGFRSEFGLLSALTAELVNFFSVTSWTWYLVTVVGLLYLRIKEPHLERPYRAWITTPITFCIVSEDRVLIANNRSQCSSSSCQYSLRLGKVWQLSVSLVFCGAES